MNFDIGSTVGDYQIIAILGAGGMGKVYKVRNLISDRIEALKILLPDLATAPDLADRFVREIKVQASLEHPNIAALHTALRVENQLLMLMEFVEGVTLDQRLKKGGPLPVADAVDNIRQVLAALDYAHGRGVIHRDIKPANMMLTPAGVVKLMDFGIAKGAGDHKLTSTGTTMGSLYYMSPEQIQGMSNIDSRADLYSVGVSLYELVTGKRPFEGDSQYAIMAAHLEKTPMPPVSIDPNLPEALNDLIMMSVAKDPNARFQTAGAFRNALGAIAPAPAPLPVPTASSAFATPPPVPQTTAPVATPLPQPQPQADFHLIQPTPPEAPRGKRGLWMAIGALAAVAAVVGVVQFAPWKGKAAPDVPAPQTAPVQQATPTPTQTPPPNPEPVAPPKQAEQSATSTPAVVAPPPKQVHETPTHIVAKPPASNTPVQQQTPVTTPSQPMQQPVQPPPSNAAAAPPQAPAAVAHAGPSRAELQDTREKLMMINTRAAGVRTSLHSLQQSQAASGLNLRGDMQEAANMMNSYLEGATSALQAGDNASAKSFMDKAERQLERLEKFLNR